jgi:hypothetical protein
MSLFLDSSHRTYIQKQSAKSYEKIENLTFRKKYSKFFINNAILNYFEHVQ